MDAEQPRCSEVLAQAAPWPGVGTSVFVHSWNKEDSLLLKAKCTRDTFSIMVKFVLCVGFFFVFFLGEGFVVFYFFFFNFCHEDTPKVNFRQTRSYKTDFILARKM